MPAGAGGPPPERRAGRARDRSLEPDTHQRRRAASAPPTPQRSARCREVALGTAIVYHGLVEAACRWLDLTARTVRAPGRRGGWRALVGRGRRTTPGPRRERCPVCLELAAAERSHLDGLLASLTEAELGAAYAASDGLCLPHLELALARAAAGPAATRLVALSQEKLRALADDLRRFVDKHDHRVTPRLHRTGGRRLAARAVPRRRAGGGVRPSADAGRRRARRPARAREEKRR